MKVPVTNLLVGLIISVDLIRDKNACCNKWSQHKNGSQSFQPS